MTYWEQRRREFLRNPVALFWYKVAGAQLFFERLRCAWDSAKYAYRTLNYRQPLEGWEHLTVLKAVIEKTNTGYSGYFEAIPGLGAAGSTIAECTENLHSALAFHRESYSVNPQFPTIVYLDAEVASMVQV